MSAYVYGSKVEIIDFHIAKHGSRFARVRILETGWLENVPVSCIEVRV